MFIPKLPFSLSRTLTSHRISQAWLSRREVSWNERLRIRNITEHFTMFCVFLSHNFRVAAQERLPMVAILSDINNLSVPTIISYKVLNMSYFFAWGDRGVEKQSVEWIPFDLFRSCKFWRMNIIRKCLYIKSSVFFFNNPTLPTSRYKIDDLKSKMFVWYLEIIFSQFCSLPYWWCTPKLVGNS